MSCDHANRTPEEDERDHVTDEVCTDCGMCLMACACGARHPATTAVYAAPEWCRGCDLCTLCCDNKAGPLTEQDKRRVVEILGDRLLSAVALASSRGRSIEQAARHYCGIGGGGSRGENVDYSGRGVKAEFRHRSGRLSWREIAERALNIVKAQRIAPDPHPCDDLREAEGIAIGAKVSTSYDTGPYRVIAMHTCYGGHGLCLTLVDWDDPRQLTAYDLVDKEIRELRYINDVHRAEDGQIGRAHV